MNGTPRELKGFQLGLLALGLVGIFLAVSAVGAVRAVLQSRGTSAPVEVGSAVPSPATRAARVDQSVMIAAAIPGERDPFRDPPAPRAGYSSDTRAATQAPQEIPICNGLLFDNVSPAVELTWSGGSSGWLHAGDEFLGWKIVQITPKTVTIAKGSESRVLHSP